MSKNEEEELSVGQEMSDEAKLFVAMTHDLHVEYWQDCYENEHLATNLNSNLGTAEERVVRPESPAHLLAD
jgi:hypothetical protein